jgi:hypothetical protein
MWALERQVWPFWNRFEISSYFLFNIKSSQVAKKGYFFFCIGALSPVVRQTVRPRLRWSYILLESKSNNLFKVILPHNTENFNQNIKYNISCVWCVSILYEQLKLFFALECYIMCHFLDPCVDHCSAYMEIFWTWGSGNMMNPILCTYITCLWDVCAHCRCVRWLLCWNWALLYLCVCVCVCVRARACVRAWERERYDDRVFSEWWIWKDMEGSGRGLIEEFFIRLERWGVTRKSFAQGNPVSQRRLERRT